MQHYERLPSNGGFRGAAFAAVEVARARALVRVFDSVSRWRHHHAHSHHEHASRAHAPAKAGDAVTPETLILIATIAGTFIGALYTSIRTSHKLKPLEKKAAEQSQKMQTIQDTNASVDKRISELEADKALLEEARAARDRRIDELEKDLERTNSCVVTLETHVRELNADKAKVVFENDELKAKLSKAQTEIEKLNVRVITLEAQLNAEKSVGDRVVQPIIDALARLAAPALATGDTGRLDPAKVPTDKVA